VADNTIGKYTRGKLLKLIDQRADGLVAGGEANQNAFSNVTVSGSTISAGTTTDTFTIAEGDNIKLSVDVGTKTITISSDGPAGGGGGTPGGSDTQIQFNDGGSFGGDSGLTYNKTTDTLNATRLTASQGLSITNHLLADNGIVTISGQLTASNGLTVSGDVSFDDASFTGDVTLGDAATDITTVTGHLTASNGVDITGHLTADNGIVTISGQLTASNGISVTGNSEFDAASFSGQAAFDGAVLLNSTTSVSGQLTASNGISVTNHFSADDGVVTITGQLTASNGLSVTGDVSFDDASFTGDVTLGDAATDVTTVTGHLTASNGVEITNHMTADNGVVAISGQLTASNGLSVTGLTNTGDLVVSNFFTASNGMFVLGDSSFDSAAFSGDVTLGNSATDVATVTGQLTASNGMSVSGHLSADNGVVTVSGQLTASNGLSVVGDVSFDDASFTGDVTLGNAETDVTTVTGHLTASNGIEITNHLSADDGIVTISGQLTASNGLSVTGDVSFDDASFTGDVTLGDAATDVTTVTGQLTASNGLSVTGDASFDAAAFSGDVTLGDTGADVITVSGQLTASSGLRVLGSVLFVDEFSSNGNVTLGNASTDVTTITGQLTASNGMFVANHMVANNGIVAISGQLTASNGLSVTGDVNFDDASFTGDVTLGNAEADVTTVTGHLTASNGINITNHMIADNGVVTISGQLTASNGLRTTALGATTITAATITASNGIAVTGSAKFANEMEVAGDLLVDGGVLYANSSNNRVGVGTDSPSYKLHVQASAADTPNGISAYFRSQDSDYSRIVVDAGTSTADTQVSFMNNGSSKWSIGNEAAADSFHIATGFGPFADTNSVIIKSDGSLIRLNATELQVTGTIKSTALGSEGELVVVGGEQQITSSTLMSTNVGAGTITVSGQFTASNGLTTTDIVANGALDLNGDLDADTANWGVLATNSYNVQLSGAVNDPQAFFTDGAGSTIMSINPLSIAARGINLYGASKTYFGINGFNQSGSIGTEDNRNRLIISGTNGIDVSGSTFFADDVHIAGTLFGGSPIKIGSDINLTGSLVVDPGYEISASNIVVTNIYRQGAPLTQGFTCIAVSGQEDVEADSASDELTLIAGTGINITTNPNNDSITFSATGGGGGQANQNAFSNFRVSGQTDLTASNPTDALTLVAGNNMIITTDPANETITFTATGIGSGSGDVSVYGTPVDNQLAVWKTSTSVEGDGNLTWNGTTLDVVGHTEMDTFAASGSCEITGRLDVDGNVVIDGTLVVRDIAYASMFAVSSSDIPFLSASVQNSTLTAITQSYLVLAEGTTGSINDVGIIMERAGETNRAMFFDESADEFAFVGTNANEATDGEITILEYAPVQMGGLSATTITASNGIQVTGSFKVYGNAEISGGYIGIGVSEEDVTHALTLPNNSDASGQVKANAFVTYSSLRYKNNIKPIANPLDKIANLRGVTYNWKDSGEPDVGLIAEEVIDILPEIVSFEKNGHDAFGIDYSKLTSLLLESIKAQQNMIEGQNKKIQALEEKLEKILK
jgi:hypothetical protein